MPVCEDWLRDPLSIVNNLFESDKENYETKVTEYFESKLNAHPHLIPCINELESLDHLPSTCLVRYRCMIQDSFNPIYFNSIQHLKHKKTNEIKTTTLKYKETLDHTVRSFFYFLDDSCLLFFLVFQNWIWIFLFLSH